MKNIKQRSTQQKNTKEFKKINKIKLGVNIDHIATLRQVRGGTTSYPDILRMAQLSMKSGADQITIHLREDRRHIQLNDLVILTKSSKIPINLEMAATDEMASLVIKHQPSWVCIVPEKRKELTTEGGLDVVKKMKTLKVMIPRLKNKGIKVSLFIGASLKQVNAAHDLGADAIELHTGHWVLARGKEKEKEWKDLVEAAVLAHELGMRVHAGHGLDLETTQEISQLPYLQEVNIGHSIVCYAIEFGLSKSIKLIKAQLKK